MCITQDGKDFRPEINNLIRIKARQAIGKLGLTKQDQDDLEQEIKCDLCKRWSRFNPAKSKAITFASHLVDNAILTIFEHSTADKRDFHREAFSLDGAISDGHGNSIQARAINDSEGSRWLGLDRRHFTEIVDLGIDITGVLTDEPAQLRDLCEHLRSLSIAEVKDETGIPRGTLYDRKAKVQEIFRKAGLDEYLPRPPGASPRRSVSNKQEHNDD